MKTKLTVNFPSAKITATPSGNIYNVEITTLNTFRPRQFAFSWVWDDYDGAPDAGRQFSGDARTFAELFEQIREAEEERAEEGL